MRIGFVPSTSRSQSVRAVLGSVYRALAAGHEVHVLPPPASWPPRAAQDRIADAFVAGSDVILGMLHPAVLDARRRARRTVPYVVLMLGTMPRGAFGLRPYVPHLTRGDTLVVNCGADRAICEMYFPDATTTVLPLAIDDATFGPTDEAERARSRDELGLDPEARVVLYAGRITPEKNLHTVLRAFRMVVDAVPNAYLVLAGAIVPAPFRELGILPTHFGRTLGRAAHRLGLPPERVLYAGPVPHGELRHFYAAADVVLNLTLHHDENFGLAQVEAMACGVPVVGTMWGGLQDTIRDGESGYRVSTAVTPIGVKVDWWEAANRVIDLLLNPVEAREFGERAARIAVAEYSPARFRGRLETLVGERAAPAVDDAGSPITISAFARDVWETCDPDADPGPPFRRTERAFELYRRLIAPYAGLTSLGIAAGAPLESGQVLSLASPVTGTASEGLRIDDPLYPFRCTIPGEIADGVDAVLAEMRGSPALPAARLLDLHSPPSLAAAVTWMLAEGLISRTAAVPTWVGRTAPGPVSDALFTYQDLLVDGADFLVTAGPHTLRGN